MQVMDPVIDLFASVRIGDIGALFELLYKMDRQGLCSARFRLWES